MSVNILRWRLDERLPSPHEERPARPQNHRRAQCELHPARCFAVDPGGSFGKKVAHRDQEDRQRQGGSDLQPPRHVAVFCVLVIAAGGKGLRLERHAALRATPRTILLDLRVHRARVDASSLMLSRSGCAPEPCRISHKLQACRTPCRGTSGKSILRRATASHQGCRGHLHSTSAPLASAQPSLPPLRSMRARFLRAGG